MKRTILLVSACLSLLALMVPAGAHAETWDYLFEDLSWPGESFTVSGGWGTSIGNFTNTGTQGEGAGQGSFWDYLFEDLSWPTGDALAG